MWTMEQRSVDDHLARIGAVPPPRPTSQALADLQLAHLLHVPFENLDIHLDVPIELDPASIHAKIVDRRRGGYCYELNSAFGALLGALGFGVEMVSARVASDDGELGPEFDHLALLVRVVDHDGPLLVDVGFGDAFTKPVPLVDGPSQPDRDRLVRLVTTRDGTWRYEDDRGGGWTLRYSFSTVTRELHEFSDMNEHQQTSPDSNFTQQTVCSLLTPAGRDTISGDRLILTVDGERTERRLTAVELDRELRDRFGLDVRLAT